MEVPHGMTLLELVVTLAVSATLCAIVVPGVVSATRTIRAADAAQRLSLVLRDAQAFAEATSSPTRVSIGANGNYVVSRTLGGEVLSRGDLGAQVTTTYPQGVLEFTTTGLPTLSGGGSPRAGHFTVAAGRPGQTVVVQLGGCVRCV